MNPISPIPALVSLAAALLTAWALSGSTLHTKSPSTHRYASIDGLRGYLAFFVFLHHASIWYFYLHSGKWETPPSHLYTHLGQGSVILFFMITGFLFFNKLLASRDAEINWKALYLSRIWRLTPLYLLATTLLGVIVGIQSNWSIREPSSELAQHALTWLLFTFAGNPDINQLHHTFTIVAGVTWSLPYEWFFYLSLPYLSWVSGKKPRSTKVLLTSALLLSICLAYWHPDGRYLKAFLGGILTCYLARSDKWNTFANSQVGTVTAIFAITATVALYSSAHKSTPLILLTLAFAIIANGNNLWGLLTHKASRCLGEMAYSIYLLHGILLYALMNWGLGLKTAESLNSLQYWLFIVVATPPLIVMAYLSHKWVERPGMRLATRQSAR